MSRLEKYGIAQPVPRKEDDRLTTGRGCYADDVRLADQAYGYVVRSPHAHAEITAIDVEAARTAPGVLCVLTGADAEAAGLGHIPCYYAPKNRDGSDPIIPPNPLLKKDRVRCVGDPVAFVVADTSAQARDAAERVAVDYRPLAAAVDTESACDGTQARVWDHAPDNVAVDFEAGDRVATDAAFAAAAHVARIELVNNRVVVAAMEPRAAVGSHDPASGRYTLHTTSQTVTVRRPGDRGPAKLWRRLSACWHARTHSIGRIRFYRLRVRCQSFRRGRSQMSFLGWVRLVCLS